MTRAAAVLLFAACLSAQDALTRVGRLSFVYGNVSYRESTTEEWRPAPLNLPLSDGDHLFTDRDAQAEIRAGAATVHCAPQTGVSVAHLDDRVARLSVSEGAVNIRIMRRDEEDRVEIVTPGGNFKLLRPGSYRIDVVTAYTSISVRSGLVEAIAGPQTTTVIPGQRLVLAGNPASLAFFDAPANDAWDDWCAERDDALERGLAGSEAYVDWDLPGAEDLAGNGDWATDPDYGPYWSPSAIGSDWTPFHRGRWIWKKPWGWTWMDDAPWGFAPAHYGRWAKIKHGWSWIPGHRHHKEPYQPATVAFSPSPGRMVWTPLAPGETAASGARRNRDAANSADAATFQPPRPPVRPTSVEPRSSKSEAQARTHAPSEPVQRVAVEDHRAAYVEPAPAPVTADPPSRVQEPRHSDPAPQSHHVDDSPSPPPPMHHSSPAPPPPVHVETRSTVQEHRVETPHHTEASRSTSSPSGSRK